MAHHDPGVPDGSLDPTNPDSDDDDIPDGEEDPDGDGATNVEEQMGGTDPTNAGSVPSGNPLLWRTYGEATIAGNILTVGEIGDSESGTQPNGFHGASIALDPADSYTFTFDLSLATWDSYNDSYIGGSGTGFWDSFSISVTNLPYDTLQLTNDPLQFPFVWGGTQWGDGVLATFSDNELTLTFPGDGENVKYLNLVIDTGNPPEADNLYPSWGILILPPIIDLDAAVIQDVQSSDDFNKQPTGVWLAEEREAKDFGIYIPVNDDDDDYDTIADKSQNSLSRAFENDLVPLRIQPIAPILGGEFKVDRTEEFLRVWKANGDQLVEVLKDDPLPSNGEPIDTVPIVL